MRYSYRQAALWAALYVVLALLPLALMLPERGSSGRGFWVEFAAALGFLGLSVLALQFVVTGRYRDFAMGFGSDNLLQFHLSMGVISMGLVLAHPAFMLLGNAGYISYFDPSENFLRALALVTVILAVVAVVVTSLWRVTFRLSYERWRLLHGALAVVVVGIGLVHTIQVSHYTALWWKKGVVVLIVGAAVLLLVQTRVFKPWMLSKSPYRVVEIREERAGATTLIVEAVDHPGMEFEAGQYAWISLGDSPFGLQQHPFSLASSAKDPRRLEFTSKPSGDFTDTWREIEPGMGAFLEGPYGGFTIREGTMQGAVFIAGGVGITPIMSQLRTLADQGDGRKFRLIYANTSWEEVIFREEIEELQERLHLEVIHVLEEPPEGWNGEEGFIDEEVLTRNLEEPVEDWFYYICGPTPMMDSVEKALVARAISPVKIMSERFQIV